jgi:hypothetical protein
MIRLTIVALLVASCGASAKQVNGPDGSGVWYSITCRRTRANCIEKAGEVCPNGYETENSSEQKGIDVDVNAMYANASTTYDGQMLVKCRNAKY